MSLLEGAGMLAWNARPGTSRPPAAAELELVRQVARADGSVGRIFDGHLNAVERLVVQAPPHVRDRELAAVLAGKAASRRVGRRARPRRRTARNRARGRRERGAARGQDVLLGRRRARPGADPCPPGQGRAPACGVDRSHATTACRSTPPGSGPTACARRFHIASSSGTRRCSPGSARRGRWPSSRGSPATRSAPRQAGRGWPTPPPARRSTELAERPGRGELEALAAGRILTAQRTIDLWIDRGARAMDAGDGELTDIAVQARVGIFDACRALLDEAARACGSRPFARGGRPRPGAARPRGVPAPAPARSVARAPRRSGARGALT